VESHSFPTWHGRRLVYKCSDIFYVLADMGWVCSSHVEFSFVSSLAWKRFGQQKLRYILCNRWHRMGLATNVGIHFVSSRAWEVYVRHKLRYIFCHHGWVWSTHAELQFLYSQAWEGFGQHMLRYILFPCWVMRGSVN
jgi:hypothetical protein